MSEILLDRVIISGHTKGPAFVMQEPVSFWGGIDPTTGNIIDTHHPQCGQSIKNTILFLPGTRGSTAGPGALLETLYQGNGPAAIILTRPDTATTIAATAAEFINLKSLIIAEYFSQPVSVKTGDELIIKHEKLSLNKP